MKAKGPVFKAKAIVMEGKLLYTTTTTSKCIEFKIELMEFGMLFDMNTNTWKWNYSCSRESFYVGIIILNNYHYGMELYLDNYWVTMPFVLLFTLGFISICISL